MHKSSKKNFHIKHSNQQGAHNYLKQLSKLQRRRIGSWMVNFFNVITVSIKKKNNKPTLDAFFKKNEFSVFHLRNLLCSHVFLREVSNLEH